MWTLFLTQTHLSVPAQMGSLMYIGLTSANSILLVTFADQRMEKGDEKTTATIMAGYPRLRRVTKTASAKGASRTRPWGARRSAA
jgi:multidrug efflux pump subunit AcrB